MRFLRAADNPAYRSLLLFMPSGAFAKNCCNSEDVGAIDAAHPGSKI